MMLKYNKGKTEVQPSSSPLKSPKNKLKQNKTSFSGALGQTNVFGY